MIRSICAAIAAAALTTALAAAAPSPKPAASSGAVKPPAHLPAPPPAPPPNSGARFDLGVWTVHASAVDANFKTGDFSTPAKVVMTRQGGDITADRANGNYKTQLEGRPPGEYVSVVFVSKFEQREVEEVVTTVLERDGKWRVTGYSTR